MKRIALTQGKEALVDDEDYEYLLQWKWCAVRDKRTFYVERKLTLASGRRKTILMHREIGARAGWLKDQVDHQDRNGLNNQRSNLRPATTAQNVSNRPILRSNTSGVVGVSWVTRDSKWRAQVGDSAARHIRYFDSNQFGAAVAWRDAKAKEVYGEFACLNEVV